MAHQRSRHYPDAEALVTRIVGALADARAGGGDAARARSSIRDIIADRARPLLSVIAGIIGERLKFRNISVVDVEQTQSIQFWNFPDGEGSGYAADNSIPLIAYKPTVLRAYVDVTHWDKSLPMPTTIGGSLRVTGSFGQRDLAPLKAIPARDAWTIRRAQLDHTLNFVIPGAICHDVMDCVLQVFDASDGSQASEFPLSLQFEDVPPINWHGVLIHYTGENFFGVKVDAQPAGRDLLDRLLFVLRACPLGGMNYDGCDVVEWDKKLAMAEHFSALFAKVADMRAMSGTDDLYVAAIPPEAGCGGVCGQGSGGTALFFADSDGSALHEIGHALGRPHSPCANAAAGQDESYPVYGTFPRGSIGEVGFDTGAVALYDPRVSFDCMSYCNPRWVSPHTYLALKDAIVGGKVSTGITQAFQASVWNAETAEFLHVSFRVHREEHRVEFLTAFHLPRRPPSGMPGTRSSIVLETWSGSGELVDVTTCAEEEVDLDGEPPFRNYRVTVPWTLAVRTLRLVHAGHVIASAEVAREAPRVSIVETKQVQSERHARLMRVVWQSDADPTAVPPLEHGIRFSHDGVHWRTLVTGLRETSHVLNLDLLPGGEQCRVQVVASAGFRTAVAESATFASPCKRREATILRPSTGKEFAYGAPVRMEGGGFSPDFGLARPDECVWRLRSGEVLGCGWEVVTQTLPPGEHRITLSVSDGMDGEAVAAVDVRIGRPGNEGSASPTRAIPAGSGRCAKCGH